jgi:hypothetical protein
LFAADGFHLNAHAHALWGEDIAALALPLLDAKSCLDCGHSAARA